MSVLDLDNAKDEIDQLIQDYEHRRPAIDAETAGLKSGKLYEFVVLSRTIAELRKRGFWFSLSGKVLELKQAPGKIQTTDAHFIGHGSGGRFRIYTDIETRTLGSLAHTTLDSSAHHEIDIVAVDEGVVGNPSPYDLLLGVECKSTAKFKKSILKECLGVKREISLLQHPQPSRLAALQGQMSPLVPSEPPVEFWLVYCDPAGNQYSSSPAHFGIEFKNWQP